MSTTAAEAPAVTEAPAEQAPAPQQPSQPAPVPQPPQQRQAPVPSPPVPAPRQEAPPAEPQQPPADAQQQARADGDAAALKAERDRLKAANEQLTAERERWKQQSRQQEARSKKNHADLQERDKILRLVAEKVGVEFDDGPDAEELAKRLDEARATARSRSVELAVYTTAATAGANAAALLDSREFMARTAQLDPDAADFSASVADLVREAAQQERYQNPKPPPPPVPQADGLGNGQQAAPAQQQAPPVSQPPAPSSGADFSGAPGGNRLWTEADYAYWTEPGRDRDGTVMAKAIQDGLLANLGIGKPRRGVRR